GRVTIIVVDGMSRDGTRERVRAAIERHPDRSLRLLDNPRGIVPTALNLGLAEADADVVVRVDGHCEIAPDYLERCLQGLEASGAECVGGPIETVGETRVARAIARAQSSPFGVGGARFRTGTDRPRWVDTLAFGAYRAEVFDAIGGFDEELVRNQDDEFNQRLIQSGGRIRLDPAVRSLYWSRAGLGALARQYFQYGLYKVRVAQKRGGLAAWRHRVPAAFVVSLLAAAGLSAAMGSAWPALAVLVPYGGAALGAAVLAARDEPAAIPVVAAAFVVLHVAYGGGFLAGRWKFRRGLRS
ncbi:MAG TPA: glycosyltransferase family 2 protein, partial [Gemmatimonadota bacterium]|nr:glycosyltransferase family 2 protein [Gemmatimonadota bacterium]